MRALDTLVLSMERPRRDWDAVLDTNLKAVFLLSKAVAPGMIERRTGHIINIASLAGKNAFAGGGIYCASKWGLLGLTECMAEDLRQYGIRVSAICPGTVATDFSPHAGKDVRKMLQAEDIAHAGRGDRHAVAAKLHQRDSAAAHAKTLKPVRG